MKAMSDLNIKEIRNMFSLEGKVAVVTGGTGVFGEAICTALAAYGADIAIIDYRPLEAFSKVLKAVEDLGRKAFAATCDVTNEDEVERLVAQIKEKFGRIDILYNVAGFANRNPAEDYPIDEFKKTMDVNVLGTFIPSKFVGRVMKEQCDGKIINISSVRGLVGHTGGYAAYGPSKAAIVLLTKQLAAEWGKYNIKVNAIAPTVFRSPLNTQIFEDENLKKTFTDRIVLGRFAEREDMLGAVIYLASSASDFVTGAILPVDGGVTAN